MVAFFEFFLEAAIAFLISLIGAFWKKRVWETLYWNRQTFLMLARVNFATWRILSSSGQLPAALTMASTRRGSLQARWKGSRRKDIMGSMLHLDEFSSLFRICSNCWLFFLLIFVCYNKILKVSTTDLAVKV